LKAKKEESHSEGIFFEVLAMIEVLLVFCHCKCLRLQEISDDIIDVGEDANIYINKSIALILQKRVPLVL